MCCAPDVDAENPSKMVGLTAGATNCLCCVTGDDGTDINSEAFTISIEFPEGEDLCSLVYVVFVIPPSSLFFIPSSSPSVVMS